MGLLLFDETETDEGLFSGYTRSWNFNQFPESKANSLFNEFLQKMSTLLATPDKRTTYVFQVRFFAKKKKKR